MPAEFNGDLATPAGRTAFADTYIAATKAKGIEVLGLADHNTGEWIDTMVAAGDRGGVAVFPGCEVTTGSGADGIHMLIIGERSKTSLDFDRLVHGALGFGDSHPPFHLNNGDRQPGSSGKTIVQILDDLPEGYLSFAPHAFTENGLLSANTAKGDIRYKALHHARLAAIDAGDCSDPQNTFKGNFQSRGLDNFPRCKTIAFIATSDAYRIDDIGRRYCWIRMESPSLEGLRQAFLDHEARIICDWDPRLDRFLDRNPNNTRHAWIEGLAIDNTFGTESPIDLRFNPSLNVLVGGRGSGKSTIVAAIRQLYAGYQSLPQSIAAEAEAFAADAFQQSTISSWHRVAESQDVVAVRWSHDRGPTEIAVEEAGVRTGFKVRVVNQKELFARVAANQSDRHAAARNLLAFLDDSLGLREGKNAAVGSWERKRQEARDAWAQAELEYRRMKEKHDAIPVIQSRIATLRRQIESFDSESAREEREKFERRTEEESILSASFERFARLRADVLELVDRHAASVATDDEDILFRPLRERLDSIETTFRQSIVVAVAEAEAALAIWEGERIQSPWAQAVIESASARAEYLERLQEQGLKPDEYLQLRERLSEQERQLNELRDQQGQLAELLARARAAWTTILAVLDERFAIRKNLITSVEARSARLRFSVHRFADTEGWVQAIRSLLNLRADGFLDDVPALATWIFGGTDPVSRIEIWRNAIVTGDLSLIDASSPTKLRPAWRERLERLDEIVRLRLASELADDIVEMSFLRDGGNPDNNADWQPITKGSPGQRTAAMLALVLQHGSEPLVLDQPEDDLDTEWLSTLVLRELRASRWHRQIIVVTHNANIPVNGDADRVIVMENVNGRIGVRRSDKEPGTSLEHCGAIEVTRVREDIQKIMEGGTQAFRQREQRYNLETLDF